VEKRANLRASDADRDHVVSRLHKAATEGRIAAEELEHRVAKALKARTYGDLEETVSDLPGPRPRQRRPPARRTPMGWAVSAVRANPLLILFAIPVVAVTFAMLVAAMTIWAVLTVVVLVLGGRPRGPRGWHGPWMYTCRGRGFGPPRRGRAPRSYWA
jgi:Flp pilus assembly protein TadB